MTLSVLLIPHGFQPSYEKGFSNGLSRNDVSVELIASDRTPVREIDCAVRVANLRGSQDTGRSRAAKVRNLASYALKLARKLVSRNHDAVHLCGMLLAGTGWWARVECRLYRLVSRKLVLTVHNIRPHDTHEKSKAKFRKLYAIPDVLVVHTEKMKQTLSQDYKVPPARIVVMHHGVDDLPPTVRRPAPDVRMRLLMFGGVQRYKGVDILLRALRLCSSFPIELRIVGESRDESYAKEVVRLVDEVGLPHKVEWRQGFVPEVEVQSFFEMADAVVLPYRHIDQSGVLFTAFRFGVPVLAFDTGSFRKWVPEFAGMVIRESSPEALASALEEFYGRRSAVDYESIRGFAANYAWERVVLDLIPSYFRQPQASDDPDSAER